MKVTATPAGDGAGRDVEIPFKISVPPVDHDVVGGGCDGVDEVPNVMGNEMLPFEAALSYASAELPALRAQTATRYETFGTVGVHVQVLLVDQSRRTTQLAPS